MSYSEFVELTLNIRYPPITRTIRFLCSLVRIFVLYTARPLGWAVFYFYPLNALFGQEMGLKSCISFQLVFPLHKSNQCKE